MKRKAASKKKTPLNPFETFTSPEASVLCGGVINRDDGTVVLGFQDKKNPGSPTIYYQYDKVLLEDWEAIKARPDTGDDSKGKYVTRVFAKKYKGVKLDG